MCGRYVLRSTPQRIREAFGIEGPDTAHSEEWRPRYNIAPSQVAPVVRLVESERHLDLLRWGLIPSWAKDSSIATKLINARSETAATKPAFRKAFRSHRCVVPADGFYEWQQLASGKQPHFIHRKDGELMALAGLWEHWAPPGTSESVQTFTILTTAANRWMQRLHDRMPVVLKGDELARWLDPGAQAAELQQLLKPLGEGELDAYPVSKSVGNVRNDGEELLRPL